MITGTGSRTMAEPSSGRKRTYLIIMAILLVILVVTLIGGG